MPFIAARIVLPVYKTSSTSTRSMLSTPNGMSEERSTACGATFERSSRYSVMSSTPTGTFTPSIPRIACAIRCASGTPRRTIPISARFFVPPLFSTISCASRCSVRSISGADINWLFSTMRMVGVSYHSCPRRGQCGPQPSNRNAAVVNSLADCGGGSAMVSNSVLLKRALLPRAAMAAAIFLAGTVLLPPRTAGQAPPLRVAVPKPAKSPARPKLAVLLVVDQMRADYVDKFLGQWSDGLKRLVEHGAWFREAAYPYAATETCVGHATISTGALPATSGIVANAWWDRESQKMTTCTADPRAKDTGYAGTAAKGGDSAWRLLVPAFADELRFQRGAATRVVTFSLKARSSIMLGGHKADAATWLEGDGWVTSNVYGTLPFIEAYAKAHPVKEDYGKTWTLSLLRSAYLYDEKAVGAVAPGGWDLSFPHPLRGKSGSSEADEAFYGQWATSPFANTYLTKLAETAFDQMG